jgi:plasmid stability protein
MAQILIRGLNDKTVTRLKSRAKERGRSLESEARSILESAAGYSRDEALKIVRRWQEKFAGRKFDDSADLIREDRER